MATTGPALRCSVHPLGTLSPYKYVVICANYHGQWLLSRHRDRATWETQGGHIEPGETPIQAAVRELYEESGVTDAEVIPVCDYCGFTDRGHANGVVFLAMVHALGELPESEMAEVQLFNQLPDNLTYPNVSPRLYQEAAKHLPPDSPP
ncbi:MAG: NUDIX domain-containing protein [Clostridia bacterium]|nr:NUDIX domain-containing protein [Clostridia bacterium]